MLSEEYGFIYKGNERDDYEEEEWDENENTNRDYLV